MKKLALTLVFALSASAAFADGTPLFDGKSLASWQSATGGEPGKGWNVEDGVLVLKQKGAGDIWTKERYSDFVLELEFKTAGNSGVFIRTDDPNDNVQTGIEIQVDRPGGPSKHSVGAVYDLLAPSKNAGKKDDWNKMVITAKGNKLNVVLNGEALVDMDLDEWKVPGMNPDGSKNKFKRALKDFKREGHIGLQDHGAAVSFRNIKITPIK